MCILTHNYINCNSKFIVYSLKNNVLVQKTFYSCSGNNMYFYQRITSMLKRTRTLRSSYLTVQFPSTPGIASFPANDFSKNDIEALHAQYPITESVAFSQTFSSEVGGDQNRAKSSEYCSYINQVAQNNFVLYHKTCIKMDDMTAHKK